MKLEAISKGDDMLTTAREYFRENKYTLAEPLLVHRVCPPEAVPGLVRTLEALDLDVGGLMVVAPAGPPEVARAAFRTTARLGAELGLAELSMGMTGDLEVALEEGATMVRVGRALFGPRPGL